MIGHKTSGNWADVTSIGRNEIVFEGRNKEYGAFAVRQRYNNALLLALLIAGSIGVLAAGVPFVWQYLHRQGTEIVTVIHDPIFHPTTVPTNKPTIPPTTPKPPQHNPPPATKFTAVKPTKDDTHDTTLINKKIADADNIGDKNVNKDNKTHDIGTNTDGDVGKKIEAETEEPPLTVVQVMPKFNGSLEQYINDHTQVPQSELERGISGTAYVTFVVEKDGSITNVKLLRGVAGGPGYDEEAVKVVKGLPKWSPGMQNGHEVRVQLNLPVHFKVR